MGKIDERLFMTGPISAPRKVGTYSLRLDKNLRFLNLKNEISIARLCRELKINPKTVYAYTYGIAPKKFETVQMIADFFGVTLTDLLFNNLETINYDPKMNSIEHVSIELIFVVRYQKNGNTIKEERKVLL